MGEVLILIIIALVWWFKAAVANEDKKVNDRETGSISASPDELIKKAKRTAEDLDALRGQTEKKRPSPTEIKALHKQHRADEWERNEQRHADERAHSEKRWEIARRKQADSNISGGICASLPAGRSRAGSRPTAARCILSTWTAARTGLRV